MQQTINQRHVARPIKKIIGKRYTPKAVQFEIIDKLLPASQRTSWVTEKQLKRSLIRKYESTCGARINENELVAVEAVQINDSRMFTCIIPNTRNKHQQFKIRIAYRNNTTHVYLIYGPAICQNKNQIDNFKKHNVTFRYLEQKDSIHVLPCTLPIY